MIYISEDGADYFLLPQRLPGEQSHHNKHIMKRGLFGGFGLGVEEVSGREQAES
jgi:hypothetical protein